MDKYKNGKGNLNTYMKWPLWLSGMLLIVAMIIYVINTSAGILLLAFVILYVIIACYLYFGKYNNLKSSIEKSVMEMAKKHGVDFSKFIVPYAVLDTECKIIWANDNFLNLFGKNAVGHKITDFLSDVNKNIISNIINDKVEIYSSYGDKKYKIVLNSINFDDNDRVLSCYLFDETELFNVKQESDNNKLVVGFIYIDNFYEVAESMEDSKASMLIAMVDRKLTRYISFNSGIIKKLEKDKYFFVTTKKDIEDMVVDRFTILEETKEIIGGENNIPLTLSIGVGYEGKSIETNHDYARVAMDMALGRGGDQAVVKKGNETLYFGGKSASNVSNMRVRARVKAMSFRETLDTKDTVLIMGHKNGDFDSFGASIGAYIMAKHLGKEVHIVVNSLTNATMEVKERFENSDIYDKAMFIDGDDALLLANENTLLIIVDHNTSKMSDEPRLLDTYCDKVVFDHHRVSADSFKDAVLSYIEPSASSTCELITEIMIYLEDRLKFRTIEADALLGGIMVDTMWFSYQTNSRTFDAASYLRKKGADSDRLRKILRVDYATEKAKNEVISNTEFYKDGFAIALLKNTDEIEASVVKAEIANELINIKGVKASIVIAFDNGKYNISSRSIDEVNVQVLMEKLGGGGHRSQAGASIDAESFEEVVEKIKEKIDEMLTEEEKK